MISVFQKNNQPTKFLFTLSIIFIIVISFLLSLFKVSVIETRYDAANYIYLADQIRLKGVFNFIDSLKPIGYPLLIRIIYIFSSFLNLSLEKTIIFFQFILHTLNSLGLLYLLKLKLHKLKKFHLIIFFLLFQLNPLLLGISRETLSETLTTFLISFFYLFILLKNKYKYFLASIALSIAVVTRVFNEQWLYLTGSIYLLIVLINNFKQYKKINLKSKLFVVFQLAVPFILIVGFQYFLVYKAEKSIGLMPNEYKNNSNFHMTKSTYVYKYETYTGQEKINPSLYYYSKNLKDKYINCINNKGSHLVCRLINPISSLYIYTIKTVSIFQNHTWSTYRNNLNFNVNFVFLFGYLLFVMFIYLNYHFFSKLLKQKNKIKFIEKNFVLISINFYILLYSVFSIPESRFINPILPMLTFLFIKNIKDIVKFKKTAIISIAILTLVLYLYVDNIIKISAIIQ